MTISQYFEIISGNFEQGIKKTNAVLAESDLVIEKEFVDQFSNKLKLPFSSEEEKGETGEVCFANSPELRTEFRLSFGAKDILNYVYAVLFNTDHHRAFSEYLKMDLKTIPIPTDEAIFWNLAALGNELRNIHLQTNSLSEKEDRRRGEIIKKIDEIFLLNKKKIHQ